MQTSVANAPRFEFPVTPVILPINSTVSREKPFNFTDNKQLKRFLLDHLELQQGWRKSSMRIIMKQKFSNKGDFILQVHGRHELMVFDGSYMFLPNDTQVLLSLLPKQN